MPGWQRRPVTLVVGRLGGWWVSRLVCSFGTTNAEQEYVAWPLVGWSKFGVPLCVFECPVGQFLQQLHVAAAQSIRLIEIDLEKLRPAKNSLYDAFPCHSLAALWLALDISSSVLLQLLDAGSSS